MRKLREREGGKERRRDWRKRAKRAEEAERGAVATKVQRKRRGSVEIRKE